MSAATSAVPSATTCAVDNAATWSLVSAAACAVCIACRSAVATLAICCVESAAISAGSSWTNWLVDSTFSCALLNPSSAAVSKYTMSDGAIERSCASVSAAMSADVSAAISVECSEPSTVVAAVFDAEWV